MWILVVTLGGILFTGIDLLLDFIQEKGRLVFKNKPTFASAMKTFTQAQNELAAAKEANEAELKEVETRWAAAKEEGQNIDRVTTFFNNLLGADKKE